MFVICSKNYNQNSFNEIFKRITAIYMPGEMEGHFKYNVYVVGHHAKITIYLKSKLKYNIFTSPYETRCQSNYI